MDETITKKIEEILREVCLVDSDIEIKEDTLLLTNLGVDSLDILELESQLVTQLDLPTTLSLESAIGDLVEGDLTFGQLCQLVEQQQEG